MEKYASASAMFTVQDLREKLNRLSERYEHVSSDLKNKNEPKNVILIHTNVYMKGGWYVTRFSINRIRLQSIHRLRARTCHDTAGHTRPH